MERDSELEEGNKRTETEIGVAYLENEGRGHTPMHSDNN